jgi:CubicO group peptidase (beta-lactamase class C family)
MKPLRPAIFALAALSACAAPPLDPGRLSQVDKIVQAHLSRSKAPGVAIGIIDGRKISVLGYGRVAKEEEAKPRGDTVYEIGSITKVFTTFLLADLAREDVVRLNDPIKKHLPADVKAPRSNKSEITLQDLATHTSGLPKLPGNLPALGPDPYANYGPDRLYDFLSAHRLRREVGEIYEYSNLGMGLLGHILERASGQPYEQLMINRIANPLKMADTRITLTDGMRARIAPPYDLDGKPGRNWHFQALAGAGALRSSVNDLLLFCAANLGRGDPHIAETLASCHAVRREEGDRLRIGLGWHHSPIRAGGAWVTWHNGGTGGYSSWLGFVKETGTAVVVLTNCFTDTADAIGLELIELLNP